MNKSRGAAKRCLPELWCASAAQIAKARAARVGVARVRVCTRYGKVPQGKARAARVGAARARACMRYGKVPQGKSPRGTERCGEGKGVQE